MTFGLDSWAWAWSQVFGVLVRCGCVVVTWSHFASDVKLKHDRYCYRNRWSNIHYYRRSLKNRRIRCTQTYDHSCTSDMTIHSLYTSPERSTSRTNDPIDDRDAYIQLRGPYMHLTRSDQHHSTISPDTQWYHTAHLPISIPETTHTFVNRNPHAYIMQTFQLPIEHQPFLCHPLTP